MRSGRLSEANEREVVMRGRLTLHRGSEARKKMTWAMANRIKAPT